MAGGKMYRSAVTLCCPQAVTVPCHATVVAGAGPGALRRLHCLVSPWDGKMSKRRSSEQEAWLRDSTMKRPCTPQTFTSCLASPVHPDTTVILTQQARHACAVRLEHKERPEHGSNTG
jgi:hypothetical protein